MQSAENLDHFLYKAYQLAHVLSDAIPMGELYGVSIGLKSSSQGDPMVWDLREGRTNPRHLPQKDGESLPGLPESHLVDP